MAQMTLVNRDCEKYICDSDMILTDPPYDMCGKNLNRILSNYGTNHLVLITTMKQLLDFNSGGEWKMMFDFVIDGVVPKKSKSRRQPNYVHQNGVYMTRNGAYSRFDRKKFQRLDVFEANGYWPTIFHAPRNDMEIHGMAKNIDAITGILGSFNVESVCDPFAGAGSTAFAAWELDIKCTLIEKDKEIFNTLEKSCKFMNAYGMQIIN